MGRLSEASSALRIFFSKFASGFSADPNEQGPCGSFSVFEPLTMSWTCTSGHAVGVPGRCAASRVVAQLVVVLVVPPSVMCVRGCPRGFDSFAFSLPFTVLKATYGLAHLFRMWHTPRKDIYTDESTCQRCGERMRSHKTRFTRKQTESHGRSRSRPPNIAIAF